MFGQCCHLLLLITYGLVQSDHIKWWLVMYLVIWLLLCLFNYYVMLWLFFGKGCFSNSGPISRIVSEMETVVFVGPREWNRRGSNWGHQSPDINSSSMDFERLSGKSTKVIKILFNSFNYLNRRNFIVKVKSYKKLILFKKNYNSENNACLIKRKTLLIDQI
jgi:hypothetical protein